MFNMKEFDKKLLFPTNEVLLAMKINNLPGRDKEHKKIKDICDIFALAWYSGLNPAKINLKRYISKSVIDKCSKTIKKEDYSKAAIQLGHSPEEVERILETLFSASR